MPPLQPARGQRSTLQPDLNCDRDHIEHSGGLRKSDKATRKFLDSEQRPQSLERAHASGRRERATCRSALIWITSMFETHPPLKGKGAAPHVSYGTYLERPLRGPITFDHHLSSFQLQFTLLRFIKRRSKKQPQELREPRPWPGCRLICCCCGTGKLIC